MYPAQKRHKSHMERVKERQILNGHFRRVWTQKHAIDNKTPRSLYTHPKGPFKRSKSAEPLNLDKSFSNGTFRSTSALTHLEARRRALRKAADFAKPESLAGESLKYERRYLSNDVLERDLYNFAQPNRAFVPRTLLSLGESKVAKQRYYQGPRTSSRLTTQQTPNIVQNVPEKPIENGQSPQETRTISRLTDSVPLSLYSPDLWNKSPTPNASMSIRRERISPNLLDNKEIRHKSVTREKLESEEDDEKYYHFIQEVTSDIVERGVYDEKVIKSILACHLELRKNDLNELKMKLLLGKLLDDLGIPKTGFFSYYLEKAAHPENIEDFQDGPQESFAEIRPEWDPGNFKQQLADQNAQNAQTLEEDRESPELELPKSVHSEAESLSLNAEDIDDLLEDRNIGRLMNKVSQQEEEEQEDDFEEGEDSESSEATPGQYDGESEEEEEPTVGEVSDLDEDEKSSSVSRSPEIASPNIPKSVQPLPVSDSLSSSGENFDLAAAPPDKFDIDSSLERNGTKPAPDRNAPPRQGTLESEKQSDERSAKETMESEKEEAKEKSSKESWTEREGTLDGFEKELPHDNEEKDSGRPRELEGAEKMSLDEGAAQGESPKESPGGAEKQDSVLDTSEQSLEANPQVVEEPENSHERTPEKEESLEKSQHSEKEESAGEEEENQQDLSLSEEVRMKRQNFLQKLGKVDETNERDEAAFGRQDSGDHDKPNSEELSEKDERTSSFEEEDLEEEDDLGRGFPPLSPITEMPESPDRKQTAHYSDDESLKESIASHGPEDHESEAEIPESEPE